ncbi:kinase-like domain-containing protein [Fimicolochytrium jonesii]|uniref:kinase-like domain-containing protein n=1 Tax=Fimicolochytrium jonesii TaxID=1396493 RepID=UPI0022FF293A|nr:kinase-like domain-containing protein [Fimicolochytrium jonesii]KAI8817463.1 kinase-like domain-containing protein [Fimicolochytrium jonesii]
MLALHPSPVPDRMRRGYGVGTAVPSSSSAPGTISDPRRRERAAADPYQRVRTPTGAMLASAKSSALPSDGNHDFTFMSPQKPSKRFSNNIEDYEMGEMLGRGGFGFVHRAVCKSPAMDGREVAIKMIDKRLMKAANMTRRVGNEVEIHWQLHHPSILELYNYFEDKSYVYLVMEICQNGELYQYIHHRKFPLTEPEARGVVAQIVRGLLYLHANGIIHRDLKLSNLLLTENYDVKIGDFGLAVKLNDPSGEQKTMCGTPNYISPEIISRLPYGLASDVWSLGCMVVTLLTGTPPFESQAVKNTLDKVSRVEYTLPDHISPEAQDLVHRLLQKDPKKRLALTKVLSHPFFEPTMPVSSLRPLNAVFDKPHPRPRPASTHQAATTNDTSRHRAVARSNNRGARRHEGRSQSRPESVHAYDKENREQMDPRKPADAYCGSRGQSPQAKRRDASSSSPGYASAGRNASSNPQQTTSRSTTAASSSTQPASPLVVLPEFSTQRLKPLKQKTKHGTVSILASGDLLLDFLGEEFLMLISGDSRTIELFDRSTSPTDPQSRPIRRYTRTSLPSAYVKKYRYASRFVDLVRSKTPKIVFYSPQAKCILMENAPLADFDILFYNGTRAHYSVSSGLVEIKIPVIKPAPGQTKVDDKDMEKHAIPLEGRVDIPPHLALVVKHVQECLRRTPPHPPNILFSIPCYLPPTSPHHRQRPTPVQPPSIRRNLIIGVQGKHAYDTYHDQQQREQCTRAGSGWGSIRRVLFMGSSTSSG